MAYAYGHLTRLARKMNFSIHKQKKASENIHYEILMFDFTSRMLRKQSIRSNQLILNTFLESWLVHLRNLLDFFYTDISKRYKDDVLARDFVKNARNYKKDRAKFRDLKQIKKKIAKQLAHLTYHRSKYNNKTRLWNFNKYSKEIFLTIFSFYDCLPKNKKRWKAFSALKSIIDERFGPIANALLNEIDSLSKNS